MHGIKWGEPMTCHLRQTHFRFESSIGCIPVAGRSAACTGSSAAPAAGAPAPPAGPDSQGTAALRTHGTARTSARSARPVTFPTFDHQPLVHMFKLTLKEPKKPLSDLGWVGEHKNTNPGAQGHLLHYMLTNCNFISSGKKRVDSHTDTTAKPVRFLNELS